MVIVRPGTISGDTKNGCSNSGDFINRLMQGNNCKQKFQNICEVLCFLVFRKMYHFRIQEMYKCRKFRYFLKYPNVRDFSDFDVRHSKFLKFREFIQSTCTLKPHRICPSPSSPRPTLQDRHGPCRSREPCNNFNLWL